MPNEDPVGLEYVGEIPTAEQIVVALNKTGYLFEQKIAEIFSANGYIVATGRAFRDPDSGTSRELDVFASRTRIKKIPDDDYIVTSCRVICECKNNQSPLVFVARKKSTSDILSVATGHTFPFAKKRTGEGASLPTWETLELGRLHYASRDPLIAGQVVRMERKKEWVATNAGIYDSWIYPLAKAVVALQASPVTIASVHRVDLVFPLIVTPSSMYIIDGTGDNPIPEPRDHVTLVRQLDGLNISGRFQIDFVRADYLPHFIRTCINDFWMKVYNLGANDPDALTTGEEEDKELE
ncbi:hypothetical protein FDG2_0738 [Candidatus Protofrankia californiensis]|uniref:Uncharacterized protein n=1 Tax=Candidatus Protofrankia californiensis TaxID=1839754 RepID=A0A1C3NUB9_9ACTN|nr:hypothetical protein FDG2_0738 [Candidatus Protofrankia californiensis]